MYRSSRLRLPGRLSLIALAIVLSGGCNDTNVTTVTAAQVSISPSSTSIKVGETTRLTASVLSSDGLPLSGRPIQWTSLDEDKARVDNDGVVLGLAVGIARIRASAEGASGTAQVTVTSGPAIQATPATVEFSGVRSGANPGDRTVVLTNIGDGILNGLAVSVSYPAGGPTGWLSAALAGNTAPATLVLGATLGSLAIGTYTASVTVTSPVATNSPITVPVQLQVLAPSPAIALGATTVGFNAVQGAGSPAPQTVTVTNAGGGTLSGLGVSVSYTTGQPTGWLNAALGASTAPTSVTLTATTGSLAAGSYSASVQVASGVAVNGPQNITVTFTVGTPPPAIDAQPSGLTFTGVSPAAQQIQLTNGGGGTLSGLAVSSIYPAGQPSGWLTASLNGTTAPATLTVNANSAALAPGSYTAAVRITATGAANSPFDVPVTFTVPAPAPAIALGARTVGFNAVQGGGNPAPQTVTVTNAGGGTLSGLGVTVSYATGQPTGWLGATLGASTAPTNINLTAATGALPAGSYTATVRVASGVAANSPQDITVAFTVSTPLPAINAQPASVTFTGVSPAAQQVQVTNSGGGTLSGLAVSAVYPAGQPTGWLTASLNTTTAPATLTLGASSAALAPGSYTATARITATGAANSPLDVSVTFTVPMPAIALSANTVGFNAVQGAGDPAPQTVGVTNAGGGTLSGLGVTVSYASGQPTGWLSAAPGATTAPTNITLTAATGSLTAGSYTATVRVASAVAANSPQDITVTFTVSPPPPAIAVQPTLLSFTAAGPAQIQITNSGGGTLSGLSVTAIYPAGQPTGWLTTGLSGTTAPATLTVTASSVALAPGSYTATVQITAPGAANSPLDVPVSFTVAVPPPSPAIALGANTVGFNAVQGGGSPAAQTVTVTNAGGGTLSGLGVTVSYATGQPTGWLGAALGATTAPTDITLTAATGSLTAGSYSATVQVASGVAANSPQNIAVTFTVGAPQAAIGVQPTSLTFTGVSPADQQVQVTNSGGGTLSGLSVSTIYPTGQATGWLTASLNATTAPATVTVNASGAALAAGTYTATVQITAPGAANTPLDVPVTFTVPAPAPAIALGANTAGFNAVQGAGDPAPQTVAVTNGGGGTLSGLGVTVSYASGQPTGWLNAALGATTAPTDITLTAATGSLTAGSYSATVEVASAVASNSPQNITVTFTVAAPQAAIGAQPTSLTFTGVTPADQQIQVTNSGGGTLSGLSVSTTYTTGQPTGWLTAGLNATTAPATVTVNATGAALAAGTYTATVQITAPGAANTPLDVPVTFTVPAPAPAIALGANTAGFNAVQGGIDPAPQTVTVTNGGGGTLSGLGVTVSYASGQPTGWLNAALGTTSAPTDITLTAATGSLAAGSYSATVQVTSGVASNSPQDITVTFTVTAAAPAIPTGLSATALSSTQVSVTWIAVPGVTEYRVRRKNLQGGAMTQTFSVPAANTSFVDSGLTAGRDYEYDVQACNLNVCSAFSAPVTVTTP